MVRVCTRLVAEIGAIEHTGDHIFGLMPLMASIANGAGGMVEDIEDPRAQSNVDVEVSFLRNVAVFPTSQDS